MKHGWVQNTKKFADLSYVSGQVYLYLNGCPIASSKGHTGCNRFTHLEATRILHAFCQDAGVTKISPSSISLPSAARRLLFKYNKPAFGVAWEMEYKKAQNSKAKAANR